VSTKPGQLQGERLVVCRNPLVAADRARKREELLAATERGLQQIAASSAAPFKARTRSAWPSAPR
jgi:hypothetical protein